MRPRPARAIVAFVGTVALLASDSGHFQAQSSLGQFTGSSSGIAEVHFTTGERGGEPMNAAEHQARLQALRQTHGPLPRPDNPNPVVPPPPNPPIGLGPGGQARTPLASTDFVTQFSHVLTETAGSGGVVHEPSVGNMGNTVFMTANWYAARSTNGGQSFTAVNPSTTFPSVNNGFCCDQVVNYAPKQDLMLWLLQYIADSNSGTQRLAVGIGPAMVGNNSWNYYDFNPQNLGYPSGNWLDFPDVTISETYVYMTSNVFQTGANGGYTGSVVWRVPLASLAAGGNVPYEVFRTTGTLRCTAGATTTMYCITFNPAGDLRVYAWADNVGAPTQFDVVVPNFTFLGQDGVATVGGTNWAARADSRMGGAWNAKGVIGVMWPAKQDSVYPYPYTIIARINEHTRQLIESVSIWNSTFAWIYGTVSPNAAGDVAGVIYAGGGSLLPQAQHWIVDYVSPSFSAFANYSGASSVAAPNQNIWGDFYTVRPHKTNINTWVSAAHFLTGGGADANSRAIYSRFGRQGDFGATNRPTVTTGAASGITRTSATMTGTVNPNGALSFAYFEYGTTTNYGSSTASQNVGSSTSAQNITAAISALACGTEHHYRLRGSNVGESTGGDRTFTTSACIAPTVTTGSATGIGALSATLNGTVNPNDLSTATRFDYGTTTSYGSQISTATLTGNSAQSISAIVALSCGRQYFFRARGTNSAGTSLGSGGSFTTTACVPPSITLQPQSQSVAPGQSAVLTVAASGTPTLSYQWYSGNSGTTTSPVGGATGPVFNTPAATSARRYWVRVSSPYGNASSGTARITIAFTDDLVVGTTAIRALHISELRDRINALRVANGVGAFNWSSTIAQGVAIRASHITELRTALAAVYSSLKQQPPVYTDPALAVGAVIRRQHILELRSAVLSLE